MDGTIYEFDRLPRVAPEGEDARGLASRRFTSGDGRLIGVIRNPLSHRNRGLAPDMADHPGVVTETPHSREELGRVLANFAERGIDILVVDGGDGTMRDILTCGMPMFGRHWPRLLILPKGKTNALAADLGLPNRWPVADALAAAAHGRIAERRPLIVDRADRQDGQVLGFILGAGVFTTAIRAGQTAHRFGAFNSFAVALITIVGIAQALFGFGSGEWRKLTRLRYGLGEGGKQAAHSGHGQQGCRFAILVSTLSRFPLGMRPFGRFRDGLNFVILDAPLRRVVALVPALLAGIEMRGFKRLGVHRGTSPQASFECEDKFILDGEAFPPGKYRLRMGPSLQFIVP